MIIEDFTSQYIGEYQNPLLHYPIVTLRCGTLWRIFGPLATGHWLHGARFWSLWQMAQRSNGFGEENR